MQAFEYNVPGMKALDKQPMPEIQAPTDAIVKMTKTTICGTDLHILKGDVPACQPGRILDHEGIGIIHTAGPAVTAFKAGDRVLISCISPCGKCLYCRTQMLLNSLGAQKTNPKRLIPHRFRLDHIFDAYETFGHAADTRALKVIIETS
jgi:threonine dehydrogenase-like Zn-dependent dehydrogenase